MATRRVRWYPAIGRPLFFALAPESSHRLATALLGVPLPWARIGGATTDPALTTDLGGIALRNPIGLAAGFDKSCRHLGALGELGFGYVVGGTITRAARAGNPAPRIARSRRRRSMVNAMGLPNPGADAAAASLRRRARGPARRIVSLADEALDDVVSSLELLEPLVDGLELNASCPNVSWGRDGDNESHLRSLVDAVRARTPKPLFVKLPPFVTDTEREVVLTLAGIARDAGATGLTCSNTRPVADARLSVGRGGLSGRALWPLTTRIVADVHAATAGELPINACGGVFTADDVATCLEAGATTVQIYSALVYEGPGVVGDLTSGLAQRNVVLRGR
ncbi:MAG: dihydroorotate dehydrogenase 2 [Actinomycetota bacterium]|nr:dihydroorotate dehydrogenase 2 [Actinomycetota bacterium]MDH5312753.1 dihydroorotate dehydrogenase 2 [Actinomycetota bacterium]